MKTLLLFALVCSALAIPQAHLNAAFEAQTTAKVLNVISSHKSPLLESVEALIEAGAPLDDILDLLYKIRDGIISEQSQHDDNHDREQKQCAEDIDAKETEIEHLKSTVSSLEATIASENSNIASTERSIGEKHDEIAQNTASQESNAGDENSLHESRDNEVQVYQTSVSDHEEALEAIAEVQRLLRESTLTSDIAVKQDRSSAINSMIDRISSKKNIKSSTVATLSVLKIMAKAPEDVNKLLDLLERLAAELRAALQEIHEHDEARQVSYEKQLADLHAESELLSQQSNQLHGDLEALEAQLAGHSNALKYAEDQKDLTVKQLELSEKVFDDIKERCQLDKDTYENETARRNDELETIDECIEIINTRLRGNQAAERVNFD